MNLQALYVNFHGLENAVKKHMSQALASSRATADEVNELAYLLSKTETLEELSALIHILASRYTFLQDLELEEQGKTKQELEAIIKPFVLSIIASNPRLAAEIGAEASKADATLDALSKRFPEFGEYLKQQK